MTTATPTHIHVQFFMVADGPAAVDQDSAIPVRDTPCCITAMMKDVRGFGPGQAMGVTNEFGRITFPIKEWMQADTIWVSVAGPGNTDTDIIGIPIDHDHAPGRVHGIRYMLNLPETAEALCDLIKGPRIKG